MTLKCGDVITLTERIKAYKMTASKKGMVCDIRTSNDGKKIYKITTEDMDMFNLNEDDAEGVEVVGNMHLVDFLREEQR